MYILCLKSFLSFTTVHYYFNFCSILSLHKICICKQYFINFTHKGPNIDYIVQITLYDKLKKAIFSLASLFVFQLIPLTLHPPITSASTKTC